MEILDFEDTPGPPAVRMLHIEVPADTALEVQHALHIAVNKALRVLGPAVIQDADRLATLIVDLATPISAMVRDRVERRQVVSKLTVETEWVSALELQKTVGGHPRVVADWKRRGKIFGVTGPDGKDAYPAYQFDAAMRPLPVIADILKNFGPVSDPWPLIAWFHTPSIWLIKYERWNRRYAAPKDFLHDTGALLFALKLRGRQAEALDLTPPPAP
jgi:hypothetical protein